MKVDIISDANGSFKGKEFKESGELCAITALEAGMVSGKPSVGFISLMSDGKYIFSQTSMEIFLAASDIFRARYCS